MKANTKVVYQIPQQSSVHNVRSLAATKKEKAEEEVGAMCESPSDLQNALENRRQEWRTRSLTEDDIQRSSPLPSAICAEPMSTGLPRRRRSQTPRYVRLFSWTSRSP